MVARGSEGLPRRFADVNDVRRNMENVRPAQQVPASEVDRYVPPAVEKVGDFATDTMGSYSVGSSDDSDAGQYYSN
ncbi:lasso RiPP family leader peptide-containing protein [Bailinhaonella thermotolerans]|uniref:Lasso RiPP family leader peptide-containing protein n=2 Tax=Bailinhaonella thermotolerans TaxID=1070861 RepID=A0A3A4ABX3_9ACTN|nr:lasso RiPP family leader peptide-containing protein [Bailinhaonella thermotolerans]